MICTAYWRMTAVASQKKCLDVVVLGNEVGEFDVWLAAASLFWSCRR